MLKLIKEALMSYRWFQGEDRGIYVPGMTQEDWDGVRQYEIDGGFHCHWSTRPNDYYWALEWLKKWRGDRAGFSMLDVGPGATMWPSYVMDECPGVAMNAVDHVGSYTPGVISGVGNYAGSLNDWLTEKGWPDYPPYSFRIDGVENVPSGTEFDVMTFISAIEHFAAGAVSKSVALINQMQPGSLVLMTTDFVKKGEKILQGFQVPTFAQMLGLSGEDQAAMASAVDKHVPYDLVIMHLAFNVE